MEYSGHRPIYPELLTPKTFAVSDTGSVPKLLIQIES